MSLAGYLSEYSLAEIFDFVQEGNKTGVLSIEPDLGLMPSVSGTYYLAFQGGRLVSVASSDSSRNRGLLKMMSQRRWITTEQAAGLETQLDFLSQPLGTYLKSRNTVNSEQLTLLFNSQVIAATCKLFEIHHGQFKFDPQAPLAFGEMTGLSMAAKEVALLGLRTLKNWEGLAAKLPVPESALQRLSSKPTVRLDTPEFNVWNLALGEMSIVQIAQQLGLERDKVCQIGFRLSSIGLVQEVALEPKQPQLDRSQSAPKPIAVGAGNAPAAVSTSFLTNLMGFLKKKG